MHDDPNPGLTDFDDPDRDTWYEFVENEPDEPPRYVHKRRFIFARYSIDPDTSDVIVVDPTEGAGIVIHAQPTDAGNSLEVVWTQPV